MQIWSFTIILHHGALFSAMNLIILGVQDCVCCQETETGGRAVSGSTSSDSVSPGAAPLFSLHFEWHEGGSFSTSFLPLAISAVESAKREPSSLEVSQPEPLLLWVVGVFSNREVNPFLMLEYLLKFAIPVTDKMRIGNSSATFLCKALYSSSSSHLKMFFRWQL